MNVRQLAGKTCLVTGASRGLGRSIARRFWEEGASLVVAVRDPSSVESLVSDLGRGQGQGQGQGQGDDQSCVAVRLDLQDLQSARSLIDRTVAMGVPRIDVLVNNAAVQGPIGRTWELSTQAWADAITADLVAPAAICSAAVALMAKRGGGRIINLSGGGATGPRQNFSAYATAKAALVRFSETLAEEAKPLGVAVNCVAPGPMGTDMLTTVQQAGVEAAGEREIAAARKALAAGDKTLLAAVELVVFLASSASQGVTGKLISALWDNWQDFADHLGELDASDVYTLRRITGRDRGIAWCDK
jgi:NAD(P)-dependent dehydrogenase (short-subunit alcohol dehydrogenase family)